jgi:aspartate aminotransferase-like enzyme
MKKSNADVVIISSHKGLALQPGMSFIAVTKEAFESRCIKNPPESLYFRFINYYPEILRGQTEFTPAIGIVNQLRDKLRRVAQNGVQTYIDHCAELARYFRNALVKHTSLKYVNYTLSNCVTPVLCSKNNAKQIVSYLRDEHEVYVPGNI